MSKRTSVREVMLPTLQPISSQRSKTVDGRVLSPALFLVLCVSLGADLPGELTIPERIGWYKGKYHSALEAADRACKAGQIDVSEMTALLRNLLEAQLLNES
jgi:hypothetical protein